MTKSSHDPETNAVYHERSGAASTRNMADKPDFRTHLLHGPKFDEFSVDRNLDLGRAVDL